MPKAKLPTNPKGWAISLAASLVGFLAGFIALDRLTKWFS